MRAAVLHAAGTPLSVEDVELDPPLAGEVLVRIRASGVCHSDLMAVDGTTPVPVPTVLGHEAAGVVESTGAGVANLRAGDRVVLSWSPQCGSCFYCLSGRGNLCERYAPRVLDGTLLDGTTRLRTRDGLPIAHYSFLSSFAEAAVVPASCCIPLPDDVPFAAAALVGCAVMTGIGAALITARVRPGSTTVILGCGGVGISAIQGCAVSGAGTIIAVDVVREKEALARRFGATAFVQSGRDDVAARVLDLTDGRGADYVFEATGLPDVMRLAYDVTRRAGTLVYIGVAPAGTELRLPAARLPRDEKIVTGSFYGGAVPARDFPKVFEMYRRGRIDLDGMISRRLPLERIDEALAMIRRGNALRSVIEFREED